MGVLVGESLFNQLPPEIKKRVTNTDSPQLPYKHLQFICGTSIRKPQAKDNVTYKVRPEPYFQQFMGEVNMDCTRFLEHATYHEVRATIKNVEKATLKYDCPPVYPNNQ